MGFNLKSLKGARVESAQLRLTLAGATGVASIPIATSGIQGRWTETTTWSDQPERTSTSSIQNVGSEKGVVTWDMTALINQTVEAGSPWYGIALSGPVVGSYGLYGRIFASRETNNGPKLTVDYVPGGGVHTSASPTPEPPPSGATAVRAGVIAAAALVGAAALVILLRKK